MWFLWILFGIGFLYLFLIAPGRRPKDCSALSPRFYAHRGLHQGESVPENSMAAFSRAVEAGYGIELDVQLTADGHLVVFHDERFDRVCGVSGRLCDTTYDHLPKLPDGTGIPLFSQVLALVGGNVPLLVEIKYHGHVLQIAEAARKMLSRYTGPYCVESFHPLVVRYFRKNAPDVLRGQLAVGGSYQKGDLPRIGHFAMVSMLINAVGRPQFISYEAGQDHHAGIWLMKHLYKPLLAAWTIRDQSQLDRVQKEYDMPIFEGFIPAEKR